MTDAARTRRRSFAVLLALGILNHAALTGARVDVSLDALARGASPATVGLLIALFAMLPMVFAVAIGRHSDRVGAGTPMLAGSAGLAASISLPALAPGFPALFASAALAGLAGAETVTVTVQPLLATMDSRQPAPEPPPTWAGPTKS